ncbi:MULTISPECIES: LacI family DNA-binding transcriptional regulator [unclassified Paenibacillus]|uniref:LacI family DNA-binding transcriptional regulator n=1 Tax=unclassified Paenibacillus TaxID=185978 RepID=UPI001C117BB5|nr:MULTISPECIES: LacI family DNA-binding transcriptional regulator [unclassified Paenibacillus]MBU5444932.1 LacI family transcriptional regulator [Paenibacillus sp. MSJ-34]CAH0120665.1 Ribose operon repressor [Paenibacillus sp. CECT 9249]
MKKRVTLDDIAKEVGISKMAVSLAMRDDVSVSQETIERVKEVARRLGYTPNRFAQGLVNGKSYTIALLIGGSLHDDYQNRIVRGAIPYAIEKGYTLSVAPSECDTNLESSYIRKYQNMMVDGFLAFHCLSVHPYKTLKKNGVPFVLYTKYFEELDSDYVVCNDVSGGYRMTQHLLELGHREIAFVYDEYLERSSEVVNRKKGFIAALEEYGIAAETVRSIPFAMDLRTGKIDLTNYVDANREFVDAMRSKDRPTALFVCNDVLASSVYMILKQLGLSIPGDVSVAGYEGVYLGQILDPPLTTVETPIEEIGRKACQLLIDKIEGNVPKSEIAQIKLEPALAIRASTGAPPG